MLWHASLVALPIALLFDRLIGDPAWLWSRVPHPVAVAGKLIEGLERRLNRLELSFVSRRRRGTAVILALLAVAVTTGALIESALSTTPLTAHILIEGLLAAILLAHKSLLDHVSAVARALDHQSIEEGRAAVAQIVGRDVSGLDEAGTSRAAIESAAENFSDGVVAPVFWFALLGLPGLIVFKMVSTANSMIGHRSSRYEAFGRASARLDDALSFLPARLSALLIALAAEASGRDGREAMRTAWRDASLHKSPNAGWPEAATAGAVGIALGGPRRYENRDIDAAWLNAAGRRDASPSDIAATVQLIDIAWSIVFALACLAAIWIVLS